MTKTGDQILRELDATRRLTIDTMMTGNEGYAAYLLGHYERACRRYGIDPDAWEGIR